MVGKHEWTQLIPDDNRSVSKNMSLLPTNGDQVSLQSLHAEINSLRLERDAYRVKYGNARTNIASLQARLDEANDQVADLKRALEHVRDANEPRQGKHQVVPMPPNSDIVTTRQSAAQHEVENDDEIEYIGSSTRISEVRLIGNFVPNKPIKHDLEIGEPTDTKIVGLDGNAPSTKCRKVEGSPIPLTTPSNVIQTKTQTALENVSSWSECPSPNDAKSTGILSQIKSPVASSSVSKERTVTSPEIAPTRLIRDIPPPRQQGVSENNPKIKQEAFVLPQSLVSGYLNTCKHFDITPPPSPLCVPRQFLHHMYGGSDRQFLQFIPPSRNPSGQKRRRIVFPMFDVNPSMPLVLGEPGLVYASRHEILEDPPWTLFSKDPTAKRAVWRYLGEYKSELCGKMSAELFRSQRLVVKQVWGESIMKTKQWDIYVAMRARIALRKGDMPIGVEQVEEEMQKIRSNNGRSVSVGDIISAFERGEEAIDIIKMQCVSYDIRKMTNLLWLLFI